MKHDPAIILKPGRTLRLKDFDPAYTGAYKDKKDAKEKLAGDIEKMAALQDKFYAQNRSALLILFQAMDAAGKDSTIKHVMSGVNPQGCQVFSFKQPSALELNHDFLWRTTQCLPQRGMIGIFNRSYYEDVLVTRVHPELLLKQNLPGITEGKDVPGSFWENRFSQINNFEKMVSENGTRVLKFFLHVSRHEQKKRFLERIVNPEKNWKITLADVEERAFWGRYEKAYEHALTKTSTAAAPWYIIPADNKWFMRTAVGDIIVRTLKELKPAYPALTGEKSAELGRIKRRLARGR